MEAIVQGLYLAHTTHNHNMEVACSFATWLRYHLNCDDAVPGPSQTSLVSLKGMITYMYHNDIACTSISVVRVTLTDMAYHQVCHTSTNFLARITSDKGIFC